MKEKEKRKKSTEKRPLDSIGLKIIEIIIIGIILGILFSVCYGVYQENKIPLVNDVHSINELNFNVVAQKQDNLNKQINILIPETYMDFPVSAKLEIPKIDLATYVLNEYTEEGMEECISKYWGPDANEVGNFCIAGHNYENNNDMFCNLIDLKMGDTMYLTDSKNGKYSYTIYDIYKVKPDNIEPLSQETGGKRIITLITCVNYSRNRLVVQAIES